MKRGILIGLFVISILTFNLVSAVTIEMHSNYSQSETLIAKISGNFVNPLQSSDIKLYRGHTRVPYDFNLVKVKNDYYLYGQLLNKQPDNYSLVLENVKYSSLGVIYEKNIYSNFTINNDIASFYIEPGIIYSEDNFNVTIQNLKNEPLSITVITNKTEEDVSFWESLFGSSSTSSGKTLTLSPEEERIYELKFENITNSTLLYVEISSENTKYSLPVYVLINKEVEPENPHRSINFNPLEANITLPTNYSTSRIFYLENDGEIDLENITFEISNELSDYVSILPSISSIDKNESSRIIINITSPSNSKNVSGSIKAKVENYSVYSYLTLNLAFVPDYVPSQEENGLVSILTCSQLEGLICGNEEVCSGKSEHASDGNCCLGICELPKKSTTSKWIGWTLLGIAVLFVLWFILKSKKGSNVPDLFKYARRR